MLLLIFKYYTWIWKINMPGVERANLTVIAITPKVLISSQLPPLSKQDRVKKSKRRIIRMSITFILAWRNTRNLLISILLSLWKFLRDWEFLEISKILDSSRRIRLKINSKTWNPVKNFSSSDRKWLLNQMKIAFSKENTWHSVMSLEVVLSHLVNF